MDIKLADNMNWLHDRTILLTITGSFAYGTNVDTSDKDYKGVCVPPDKYFFGLDSFNEYNTTGGKSFKNTKDDVDISIMHICKFVKDAMQGVPNNIEILFVRQEDIIQINKFGEELMLHRNDFLSKALKHKFAGYAHSQLIKIKTKNSNGSGRTDLIEKYSYDTKFAAHSVRLLTSAIEILNTGNFSTYRPNREELISIRNGKYTLDQVCNIIEDLDKELGELYDTSKAIPYSPDYNKINDWLIKLTKKALTESW